MKYHKGSLLLFFQFCYSHKEPVLFPGFFTSWIRPDSPPPPHTHTQSSAPALVKKNQLRNTAQLYSMMSQAVLSVHDIVLVLYISEPVCEPQ